MKIAYLFPEFPIKTQTFAISDINALVGLGHEVDVYSLKPRRGKCDALQMGLDKRVGVHYVCYSDLLLSFFGVFSIKLLASVISIARKGTLRDFISSVLVYPFVIVVLKKIFLGNYDVVHAFWGRHPSLVNYLICLFSQKQKKLNKPVLSMFVGAYDIVNPGYFVPMGLSVSDVVFTHTAANLPFFAKFRLKAEKVNVVHRGIPIYNFNKDKPRDRARFVTASALVVEKNVSAVILAFSRYNKINNNSSLVVCGDGPQIANLRRLVSEIGIEGSVAFLGHIDRKELFDIMLGAGVFVFLSEKASERLPNVIKEAMLAGCGVVSSKSIGISELIVDENYGFVVDSSNTKEIDLAIRKLVEEDVVDSNNRIELCRRHILSNFSDISSMEIYASEWMRVMERKNNAT